MSAHLLLRQAQLRRLAGPQTGCPSLHRAPQLVGRPACAQQRAGLQQQQLRPLRGPCGRAAAGPAPHRLRSVTARAGPDQAPGGFPFDEEDYYKVEFVKEPYGPVAIDSAGSQWRGVLLFQVAGQAEPLREDTRVLEIFISGDACISIYTHLCPSDNTRPMALDILWQMWQRGRLMSKRDWTLLRVAVVACVNDVYYGRLFFGDPETQQVLWDCDVRPSDATFLALKAKAPMFVKKGVWDACSAPLSSSSTWATVHYIEGQRDKERGRAGADKRGSAGAAAAAAAGQPSPDSLPAIRLLMREMEVAVREEDYEAAARIRDHPWMRLAEDINMHRSIGYMDQATKLMSDLTLLVEQHERSVGADYEARLAAQQAARAALDDMLRRQASPDGGGGSGSGAQEGRGVSNESSKGRE